MEQGIFQERRYHRIFLTHRTEYHLRGETVVAIRNRESGAFYDDHSAIGGRVKGTIRQKRGVEFLPSPASALPGDCFCVSLPEGGIVTGRIVEIRRPSWETVCAYPAGTVKPQVPGA